MVGNIIMLPWSWPVQNAGNLWNKAHPTRQLYTSQQRGMYISNETPNDISVERHQDVLVVRLHDVLLVWRPISTSPQRLS